MANVGRAGVLTMPTRQTVSIRLLTRRGDLGVESDQVALEPSLRKLGGSQLTLDGFAAR